MLGPILFNLSIDDLFFFIEIASMHNFLNSLCKTLAEILEDFFKILGVPLQSDHRLAIPHLFQRA